MAAPAHTTRTLPTGYKLPDGFKSLVAIALGAGINLWEVGVKPPGVDGGDEINTSTMHNLAWRTFHPRSLKTLTEVTITVAYDPAVYSNIISYINVNTSITVWFPDGSYIDFYAFLKKFELSELKEGEFPQATVTLVPTNYDAVNKVEAAPVVYNSAGT